MVGGGVKIDLERRGGVRMKEGVRGQKLRLGTERSHLEANLDILPQNIQYYTDHLCRLDFD